MKMINGGVTAPKGFKASGVACGLKKNGRKDLALVVSDRKAAAAGVFTRNIIKGHSLQLTMEHLKSQNQTQGKGIRAVVINTGNANACLGSQGDANAIGMASITSKQLKCCEKEVLVGSTGVIGMPLDLEKVKNGIVEAVASISYDGGGDAAEAIMTTDTVPKSAAVEFELDNHGPCTVRIGGMAKGSGMICPNMATMISVITTDADITQELLNKALKPAVDASFNRITIDGDTSCDDMVVILANGAAGNSVINKENEDYRTFAEALKKLCIELAKKLAADGEGATKLIEVEVTGAASDEDAHKITKAIANSPLVKTAIFGCDANWGRIITAAGYSGADFNPERIKISINGILFCQKGTAVAFDEAEAKKMLSGKEIRISVGLSEGSGTDTMWTCDYSYDYVKINGSYRS